MIEEPPRKKPGENGFYVITNGDIYQKITKLDTDMQQLKHSFRMIGFVVMPAITAVVTLLINSTFA